MARFGAARGWASRRTMVRPPNADGNKNSKPFTWTKAADGILERLAGIFNECLAQDR
jgi:hypothetical protein